MILYYVSKIRYIIQTTVPLIRQKGGILEQYPTNYCFLYKYSRKRREYNIIHPLDKIVELNKQTSELYERAYACPRKREIRFAETVVPVFSHFSVGRLTQ